MHEVLERGYRGASPRLAGKIPEPPDAGRLGDVPGREDPLRPEESTSAIVAHHPQARHFTL
jgi:hypothetical protein